MSLQHTILCILSLTNTLIKKDLMSKWPITKRFLREKLWNDSVSEFSFMSQKWTKIALRTCGRWNKTCDTQPMACDTWHVTPDLWHLTCDTWHMTPDTWALYVFVFRIHRAIQLRLCLQTRWMSFHSLRRFLKFLLVAKSC